MRVARLVVVSGALGFCAGFVYFNIARSELARLSSAYHSLHKGVARDAVIAAMEQPMSTNVQPVPYWDEKPLSNEDIGRISSSIQFTKRTFFLPVSYRYSFDTNGFLVGKHRYD